MSLEVGDYGLAVGGEGEQQVAALDAREAEILEIVAKKTSF